MAAASGTGPPSRSRASRSRAASRSWRSRPISRSASASAPLAASRAAAASSTLCRVGGTTAASASTSRCHSGTLAKAAASRASSWASLASRSASRRPGSPSAQASSTSAARSPVSTPSPSRSRSAVAAAISPSVLAASASALRSLSASTSERLISSRAAATCGPFGAIARISATVSAPRARNSAADRKSTRLNSSHTVIYTLSLHDALPIFGALDQLARRRDLRPVRRDRQDLRDGFGAKGPQQRGKPRGALPGFGLVRGQIAMVGGDPVARPFERGDALPRRQQPLVRLFRGQLPEEAVEPVRRGPALQRSQSDRLPGLPPSASGIGRQARRRLRRRQFPLGRLPLLKPRAHALDALQPRDRGLTRRLFAGQRRPPIARAVAFALQLLPIPRPHRRGAQRGARLAERGERLLQGPRPRLPLRRQRVAPALEAFAQAAQAGDAAAGGEQRLGEIAAGSQHRFGAAAQQMAVEREQALEQRLVGLSDQPLEDAR